MGYLLVGILKINRGCHCCQPHDHQNRTVQVEAQIKNRPSQGVCQCQGHQKPVSGQEDRSHSFGLVVQQNLEDLEQDLYKEVSHQPHLLLQQDQEKVKKPALQEDAGTLEDDQVIYHNISLSATPKGIHPQVIAFKHQADRYLSWLLLCCFEFHLKDILRWGIVTWTSRSPPRPATGHKTNTTNTPLAKCRAGGRTCKMPTSLNSKYPAMITSHSLEYSTATEEQRSPNL